MRSRRLGCGRGGGAAPGSSSTSLDALVIPGGESTTISKGLEAYGLEQPIQDFVAGGRPVLGHVRRA